MSEAKKLLGREELLHRLAAVWIETGNNGTGLREPDDHKVRGVYRYCGYLLKQYLAAAPAERSPEPPPKHKWIQDGIERERIDESAMCHSAAAERREDAPEHLNQIASQTGAALAASTDSERLAEAGKGMGYETDSD